MRRSFQPTLTRMSGWRRVDSSSVRQHPVLVFFSNGVTTARFCSAGKCPSRSEAFIALTYGRSGSTSSFIRKVAIGSIAHDLVGDCMINCLNSSVLHGDSTDSDSAVAAVKAGGGRPSVAARTVRTFSSKSCTFKSLRGIKNGDFFVFFQLLYVPNLRRQGQNYTYCNI